MAPGADFPRFVSLIVHICLRLIAETYIFILTSERHLLFSFLSLQPSVQCYSHTVEWLCSGWIRRNKIQICWHRHLQHVSVLIFWSSFFQKVAEVWLRSSFHATSVHFTHLHIVFSIVTKYSFLYLSLRNLVGFLLPMKSMFVFLLWGVKRAAIRGRCLQWLWVN